MGNSNEFVTMGVFNAAMQNINNRFTSLKEEIIREIKEEMFTKKDHQKFMEWMDAAVTELKDARDERRLSERQLIRLDDRTIDHEKRIRKLEKAIN